VLTVSSPPRFQAERHYVLTVLLGDFLGLSWRHQTSTGVNTVISLDGCRGEIQIPDIFLSQKASEWLTESSLPTQILPRWDSGELGHDIPLVDSSLPILFGDMHDRFRFDEQRIVLPIDIFGSAFFMLSRYEEFITRDRDSHDRFPAHASVAYKAGFLDRPLIDEYVEVLWRAMHQLWPSLVRKTRTRTLRVTCDVDSVYDSDYSGYSMLRGVASDLLRRKQPDVALRNLFRRCRARCGDFKEDPYIKNIHWMMDVNERAGNQVAFYFISGGNHPLDAVYRLHEPVVRKLLRSISERDHEIGLHPSYCTYLDVEQMVSEAKTLRRALDDEHIPCAELGGRQHYLRWATSKTAANCVDSGMTYDSTLGFADYPGFRCGTSREFTMYDVHSRKPLKLLQRPLILMETTVVADQYLGLGYARDAWARMNALKRRALNIGGQFTLLWHNSSFEDPVAREIYSDLIG
jgi:hypothetical protein